MAGIKAPVSRTVEGGDGISNWEAEGGFIPGLITENGLDLNEHHKSLFGPEAAGIVDGMTSEQMSTLSDEELTRLFFQGTKEAQTDAASKVAGDVWTGKRTSRDVIPVGYTPEVLQMLGAKNLPLVIAPSVITKAGKDKHHLPLKAIESLPAELRDPLMVFDSATEKGALVVLTKMEHEGKAIVAAIHLDQNEWRYQVNRISSVHGRQAEQIKNWIEKGLLRYQDEERTKDWFQYSAGLQSPGEGANPSNKNILSKADLSRGSLSSPSRTMPAGRITRAPGKVNIDLLKNADLSTFLHETGHLYLEVLGDLAQAENAIFPTGVG